MGQKLPSERWIATGLGVFEAGERRTMFQTVWAEPGRESEPDTAAHPVGMYGCHWSEIEPLPDAGPGVAERRGEASLGVEANRPQRVRMPHARVSISSPQLKFRNSGLFRGL
ncbi:MAG: hypothetical protein ACR2JB_26180 [Bryobacteraceae bacterium]